MMSALSYEQKNSNILNRFESKETGTKMRIYSFELFDGKKGKLLCMDGETLDDAVLMCKSQFGESRLKNVKE